ncbi:MAG TPA: hypothetical protein VHB45_00705 [Alloacidobacterium sp.]|nr:hypothetical protein [Alloacidobacterium sp.]
MSLGARYLTPEDDTYPNLPVSRIRYDSSEESDAVSDQNHSTHKESLIEQILEFLENYPCCGSRQHVLTGQVYTC